MTYTAADIEALEGLEAVRKRPGMYIGGTGEEGFHHLLWEILDNAVDEAAAGHAKNIVIRVMPDGKSAEVVDDGRGIPTGKHPKLKISTIDVVFTKLHAGGKFGGGAYKTAGGLHGVGSAVVNALSSEMDVISIREGSQWERSYSRGKTQGRIVKKNSRWPKKQTGTVVRFAPDPDIFGDQAFDMDTVRERVRTKAYLTPGTRFVLEQDLEREEFQFAGGISDLVMDQLKEQNRSPTVDRVWMFEHPSMGATAAIAWTEEVEEDIRSFANGIPTRDGGTHDQALKDALYRAVTAHAKTKSLVPRGVTLKAEDTREGVLAAVSVFIEDPQFQGQTKDRLNNTEVRSELAGVMKQALEKFLLDNNAFAGAVVDRAIQASRARTAARAAKVRIRKTVLPGMGLLPGKLADCSIQGDPEAVELFLVEGDSAGGSAKQGRDRNTQAILPLRGKVLNTETATMKRVKANEELKNIVIALGTGIGAQFDISKLRYSKIILLMDADSDGHHIATLLLTFFFRWMPDLIWNGHIYLAKPPLYRVENKRKTIWAQTEREKAKAVVKLGKTAEVTRFKGLGEMPPQTLFTTTMCPKHRVLEQVVISSDSWLTTQDVVAQLFGKDAAARHDLIMAEGRFANRTD